MVIMNNINNTTLRNYGVIQGGPPYQLQVGLWSQLPICFWPFIGVIPPFVPIRGPPCIILLWFWTGNLYVTTTMCLNALNSFVWVAMPPPCGLESSTYIRPNKVYKAIGDETSVSFKQWLFFTFFQCWWSFAAKIQFDEVLMFTHLRRLIRR